MKKQIKMRIVDWWNHDTEKNFYENYFVKLMQKKYDIIYSENPDIILYGPYGNEFLKYDCVRIFYTIENIRSDFNMADYAIDFDFMDFGERHLRFPYFALNAPEFVTSKNIRNKFCAFLK